MKLASKYRPQKFSEVCGQDSIVASLIKCLKKKKLHHAYLFAGKYGTGKTTLARLLARAFNCENFTDDICGECDGCSPTQFDIIEIDGASNRGIDEVRKIQENARVCSFGGGDKVYIIDEVHRITSQAGDSFLKMLEEPPKGVRFIFCTTEPWKLSSTMRSRCLPFHLKPIRFRDIKTRLEQILDSEKIQVNDSRILYRIAEQSNNTLRDAVNYLEICLVNLDKDVLTLTDIENSLNLVAEKEVWSLLDYLMNKDTSNLFEIINKLVNQGSRYEDIINVLKSQVKELIFVKRGFTKGIPDYRLKQLKDNPYMIKDLVAVFKILHDLDSTLNNYINPKDATELAMLQILVRK